MAACPFCNKPCEKDRRCRHCGLGAGFPPWEANAWEKGSFLSVKLPWLETLWCLISQPKAFFRTFNPYGNLLKAWLFAVPFIVLFVLGLFAVTDVSLRKALITEDMKVFQDLVFLILEMPEVNPLSGTMSLIMTFVLYWLVGVIGLTCVMHFTFYFMRRSDIKWFMIFRLLCYALTPAFLLMLSFWVFQVWSMTMSQQASHQLEHQMSVLVFAMMLVALFWTIHLLKVGVQQSFQVNKRDSNMVVLLCMMLLMLFIYIVR